MQECQYLQVLAPETPIFGAQKGPKYQLSGRKLPETLQKRRKPNLV